MNEITTAMDQNPEASHTQETLTSESFTIGYVVGLTPEGKFFFEVLGKNQELVGLMGIHKYAEFEVQKAFQANRMSGDSLTFEVGKAVSVLNQKLDALIKTTSPLADNTL